MYMLGKVILIFTSQNLALASRQKRNTSCGMPQSLGFLIPVIKALFKFKTSESGDASIPSPKNGYSGIKE